MNNASVSVVIPVYNSQETIELVLDSVKKQTALKEIAEIIIVNDGSTDKSEEVIQRYCKNNPELPIRYFYQENRGVSAARNVGIKNTTGEFIALLDSDDVWHDNKLEKQMNVMKKNSEIMFLGTGHTDKPFRRKGKTITSLYKADLTDIFWSFFPVTPSVLFRKKALEKVGYFDETQRYCEDLNYYLRFAIHYNYYYLPENLVDIDVGKQYHGEKGLTSNLSGMHKGEMKNLKDVYSMGAVTFPFYVFFSVFLNLKYFRRRILTYIVRKKHS